MTEEKRYIITEEDFQKCILALYDAGYVVSFVQEFKQKVESHPYVDVLDELEKRIRLYKPVGTKKDGFVFKDVLYEWITELRKAGDRG